MSDGDLRKIFRQNLHSWQWSSIETAGTASGVPDSEFMSTEGVQGWIEFKKTHIFYVQVKPLQVAWLERRCRMGGKAWIAVRRIPKAAIYKGVDQLWLMSGDQAIALHDHGLNGVTAVKWEGGPSGWNFPEIRDYLTGFKSI